ncbi:molecular chaperone GrpE [Labedella gwakjiensis]|uniref:Protein GrpE n=1 Tax=Labedella gwakjiensis TaxID=390269 RepID=A0A2P8GWU5_9MICO|nr:nucleotide exchange factor GrpE [Labedella gwakjiensis]PSL38429.1 molecular chaperone GrpE [Labedella gwakjiensis]RUQ87046.1 nucleotide exchange factor GrpE [Labedella gwakjiensis]
MTENRNPEEPEDIRPEDQGDGLSAGEGPEADASGPEPHADETGATTQDEELTVQDILDAAEAEGAEAPTGLDAEPESEHLVDLKRVTAEYANYRKRTEANREVERERTTGDVVKLLLPVLDDLDRAEKHGDLQGDAPFAQIATKLRSSVERLGLRPFAAKGEAFDPNIHEAIFQQPSPDATSETILDVVETGYFVGGTLLRAAKVVVQVPAN